METGRKATRDGSRPVGGGPFAWRICALWIPICLVLGGLMAWATVIAQHYFAPWILFPLLVGVALGAMIVGAIRFGQVGNRPTILLGTLLAVAVTVAGQHYVSYLKAYRWPSWKEATAAQHPAQDLSELAKVWIPSFTEFMRRQAAGGRPPLTDHFGPAAVVPATWGLWAVDGLLVLAAALGMVVPAVRLPFCSTCRSWYRVTRSGRISAPTAVQVAELAGVPPDGQPVSARYRLLNCNEGCGPTCLQLAWQQSTDDGSSVETWLDVECRDRLLEVLDEARAESSA